MNDNKKYTLPEDNVTTIACEDSVAYATYQEDLRYGIELLHTISPEELHRVVRSLAKQHTAISYEAFNHHFKLWWQQTCIYSGPNLCLTNEHFLAIKAMGPVVLPFIEDKFTSEPSYMHRHLTWLKNAIAS